MFNLTHLTIQRARKERLAQVAGSLTFTTLLSIVPLLAASFALFTHFVVLPSNRNSPTNPNTPNQTNLICQNTSSNVRSPAPEN